MAVAGLGTDVVDVVEIVEATDGAVLVVVVLGIVVVWDVALVLDVEGAVMVVVAPPDEAPDRGVDVPVVEVDVTDVGTLEGVEVEEGAGVEPGTTVTVTGVFPGTFVGVTGLIRTLVDVALTFVDVLVLILVLVDFFVEPCNDFLDFFRRVGDPRFSVRWETFGL